MKATKIAEIYVIDSVIYRVVFDPGVDKLFTIMGGDIYRTGTPITPAELAEMQKEEKNAVK